MGRLPVVLNGFVEGIGSLLIGKRKRHNREDSMRNLYVVNPDGTVTFLGPINEEPKEGLQKARRVAVRRFWGTRDVEEKRRCNVPSEV